MLLIGSLVYGQNKTKEQFLGNWLTHKKNAVVRIEKRPNSNIYQGKIIWSKKMGLHKKEHQKTILFHLRYDKDEKILKKGILRFKDKKAKCTLKLKNKNTLIVILKRGWFFSKTKIWTRWKGGRKKVNLKKLNVKSILK